MKELDQYREWSDDDLATSLVMGVPFRNGVIIGTTPGGLAALLRERLRRERVRCKAVCEDVEREELDYAREAKKKFCYDAVLVHELPAYRAMDAAACGERIEALQ